MNRFQRGNWSEPWSTGTIGENFGSGFVIEQGVVLTNAHVVSDARMLLLYREGDPTPHEARIRAIGHDCDLALIEALDESALDGVPALSLGGVPALRSTVETFGYPIGGVRISSTRGVVSRIETQGYAHPGSSLGSTSCVHLTVQIDAAINPGNSGGPVMQDGAVVGVAFESFSLLENVGLFIPTTVIRHFLDDAADGHYEGFADLGLHVSNMENPAARRRVGMRGDEGGVRVDRVMPDTSADGVLQVGDILLRVAGHDVANDGTIMLLGQRLAYSAVTDGLHVGDRLPARVLREGRRLDLEIPMRTWPALDRYTNTYDRMPRYFIYGGLIFMPLTQQLLNSYGADWQKEYPLVQAAFMRPLVEPEWYGREPVVVLRRLMHEINAEMAWHRGLVVSQVNGVPIHSLQQLVDVIESHEGRFHVFEFATEGRLGALDKAAAEKAQAEILERYGISADRRL